MDAGLAIVGLSCRFAGAAGPDAFWRLLRDGGAAAREPIGAAPLPSAYRVARLPLDGAFFECGDAAARAIADPHRLMLELAVEAFEDAGFPLEELRGSRTAVFAGAMWHGDNGVGSGGDGAALGGRLAAAIAGRIAHHLDLRGPAAVVDTATSSALVALHFAARTVRSGEAPLALAGGVNLIDAQSSAALWRLGVLSPGEIRPFDAAADGYVRGEGGGFVVLKPLRRALADRDRVYAVLRGSGLSHEGAGRAIVAPSVAGQTAMLQVAYEAARVAAANVDYIEAHGTGTPQGDRNEAEALGTIAADRAAHAPPMIVGSVKGNVGHLEAAAGIAGVIKTALALYQEHLPATRNCATPNPAIPLDRLRLVLQTQPTRWPAGTARLAGVTALGLCGTNCHVVLQGRRRRRAGAPRARAHGHHLLVLSARTPRALRLRAEALADWCDSSPDVRLRDVCFTAAVRHSHYPHRLGIICTAFDDCAASLRAAATRPQPLPSPPNRQLVFVFGANPQGVRGYRQLAHRLPGIRRARIQDPSPQGEHRRLGEDAILSDVAAYFCRLGLSPDTIMADVAGQRPAGLFARSLGREPLTVVTPADGAVVFAFGDCATARCWLGRFASANVVSSSHPFASVLEGLSRAYEAGFNPVWRRLFGRGAVVSLPVHTWERHAPAPPDAMPSVRGCIRRHLGDLLGVPGEALADTEPLIALGVDSLGALELEERLRAALGVDVGLLRSLDELTIAVIEARVLEAREKDEAAFA